MMADFRPLTITANSLNFSCINNFFLYHIGKFLPRQRTAVFNLTKLHNSAVIFIDLFGSFANAVRQVWAMTANQIAMADNFNSRVLGKLFDNLRHMTAEIITVPLAFKEIGSKPVMGSNFKF